ncbi:MAG TPA: hypothetical protein PLI45_04385 [Candidatus Woesebacteria bacterium]|nr:hypothetical protein [Candidatus Woesebacteria bacterium]
MKGVTFLELILVIAILLLLGVISVPFTGRFLVRNNQQTAVYRVMSETWKAQDFASSGREINGNRVWGVCLSGTKFRLFNGNCTSPTFKEDYDMPVGVSISGIESVTFDNLTGEPSGVTTITISNEARSNTITINAVGMIEEN